MSPSLIIGVTGQLSEKNVSLKAETAYRAETWRRQEATNKNMNWANLIHIL